MGGHGVAMGGAIVDAGRFDWRAQAERFPQFTEPDESYHGLVYVDRFGRDAFLARARSVYQRTTGAVLAPMSAFLLLQGIETVPLRIERHVANGRAVAEWLQRRPARRLGRLRRLARQPLFRAGAEISRRPRRFAADLRRRRRARAGEAVLRRAQAGQAAGQHRRRAVACLPSRLDHPSADDRRASSSRRACGRRRCASASASNTSTTSSKTSIKRSPPPARGAPRNRASRWR